MVNEDRLLYEQFKKEWNRLYQEEKLSLKEIGRMYNVDGATVKNYIENLNLSKRCIYCGKVFHKKNYPHIFYLKTTCGSKKCKSKQRVDYAKKNMKEYQREYKLKWVKENKDKLEQYRKKWQTNNQEKLRLSSKNYITNNYEKWRESNRKNNIKQRLKSKKKENERRKKLKLPLVGEGYRSEMELFVYISSLFPNQTIIKHDRTTLGWLELDFYLPELKLGFEYMGEQHYNEELFNRLFSTPRTPHFSILEYRDRVKNKLCREKGIILIKIKYNEKLSEQLIINKLKYTKIRTSQEVLKC